MKIKGFSLGSPEMVLVPSFVASGATIAVEFTALKLNFRCCGTQHNKPLESGNGSQQFARTCDFAQNPILPIKCSFAEPLRADRLFQAVTAILTAMPVNEGTWHGGLHRGYATNGGDHPSTFQVPIERLCILTRRTKHDRPGNSNTF